MTFSEYDWNRPGTMTYPGGVTRSLSYDALMRPNSLSVAAPDDTPLMNYVYGYTPAGNILTKQTEHGNYTYDYDLSSRLTSAENPMLDDEAYAYDSVGNRTSASNATGAISHNLNNELTAYGEAEYVYDDNGNMTQKRVGTAAVNYIYNAANRLIRVEDDLTGVIIAEYGYDPFGRRLWKEVDGTRTYFFYSDEGLIAEYDETGVEIRSYGYQPDSTWTTDPLWLKEGGAYYWYQNDHLGTPQKLVAQDGTVVWSAQYAAFGSATVSVETVTNNLRFPGQYFDAETGLHYNLLRYYESRTGQYIRKDPIGLRGGPQLYGYVNNNPIRFIDPVGLIKVGIAIPNGFGKTKEQQNNTFRDIAARSSDSLQTTPDYQTCRPGKRCKDCYTGQEMLSYLAEQSQDETCPIELLTFAGHGWGTRDNCTGGPGIPGVDSLTDVKRGFYSDSVANKLHGHPDSAIISDLEEKIANNEITFSSTCTIQIYGCRIGYQFTKELAKVTKCRVVAGSHSCSNPASDTWETGYVDTEEKKYLSYSWDRS